jgi:hypothetical protein
MILRGSKRPVNAPIPAGNDCIKGPSYFIASPGGMGYLIPLEMQEWQGGTGDV